MPGIMNGQRIQGYILFAMENHWAEGCKKKFLSTDTTLNILKKA
jgi:hypothetical protein